MPAGTHVLICRASCCLCHYVRWYTWYQVSDTWCGYRVQSVPRLCCDTSCTHTTTIGLLVTLRVLILLLLYCCKVALAQQSQSFVLVCYHTSTKKVPVLTRAPGFPLDYLIALFACLPRGRGCLPATPSVLCACAVCVGRWRGIFVFSLQHPTIQHFKTQRLGRHYSAQVLGAC